MGGENFKDLTKQQFGRLTVVKRSGTDKWRKPIWECLCECGETIHLSRSQLGYKANSCGCLKADFNKARCWKGYGEISRDFWSHIQRAAADRKIKFDLTIEYGWELYLRQNRKCQLTGLSIEFSPNVKKKKPTASLDRLDSDIGYFPSNVQWVHKKVNLCKHVLDNQEFIDLCRLVVENSDEKNSDLGGKF